MNAPHRLSNRSADNSTADCSACGRAVEIRKAGRGWRCREGDREAKRQRRRNQSTAKSGPSRHRLEKRDGSPDECRLCGPVTPVVPAGGRGWMCPNRAAELRWTKFDNQPSARCPVCNTWLDLSGACAQCDDDLKDIETMWLPPESRLAHRRPLPATIAEEGLAVQSFITPLDAIESAVHGWRTLGGEATARIGFAHYADEWAGRPKYIRPEYAALYGAGSK